jgi:hypothetical protein
LNASSGTCVISGAPSANQPSTSYTVTATATDGSKDNATIAIAVIDPQPPDLQNGPSMTYVRTVAITSYSFTNNGYSATSCAASPLLPSGLSLSNTLGTCRISGTPAVTQVNTVHTVTATAADGSVDTANISITVNQAVPPVLADASNQTYKAGRSIQKLSFVNTGAAAISCEISPSLPDGLIINVDTSTCAITGNAVAGSSSTSYTVTATATDGSQDTASVQILVNPPLICPTGYVKVPDYLDTDTNVLEFCVMKYEAKAVNGAATSQAALTPWVSIQRGATATTADSAWKACRDLGTGYDLISNAQWQSIARNVEAAQSSPGVYINWRNNSNTGSNWLNRGKTLGASIVAASTDDNPCFGTSYPNCANRTHGDFAEKRTHELSNGSIIWDLGGNISEWVKDNSAHAYTVDQYVNSVTATEGTACTDANICLLGKPKAIFGPLGDYTAKTSIPYGNLGYGFFNSTAGAIRRSCQTGLGTEHSCGIFRVSLNQPATYIANNLGFRCVYTDGL